MKMRKKIVIAVVLALMVCSFCGACLAVAEFLPNTPGGWEVLMTTDPISFDGGDDPDDGIPGGPPGTPG